jgi:hypothetical protein
MSVIDSITAKFSLTYDNKNIAWYEIAFLILFLSLKIFLMAAILKEGFVALSFDDFARQLASYTWSKDFEFFRAGWPPLQFWIVGSAMQLFPDIRTANLLVNAVFSSLTLIVFYFLIRLFFERRIAILSLFVAVMLPWQLKLSLSGLCEPIYHFFLFFSMLCVFKWEITGKRYNAFLCGLSLLFANMLRIEAWIFYIAVNVYIIVRLLQYPRKYKKDVLIFTLLIPSSFIVLWILLGKLQTNYEVFRAEHINATSALSNIYVRLLRYPAYLLLTSPIIALAGIIGLFPLFRRDTPSAFRYGLIPILYFLGLIGISLTTGSDSLAAPLRIVLPFIYLFIPVSLSLFLKSGKTWFVKIGYVFLGVILIWNVYFVFNFDRNDFADIAKVSKIVKSAWSTNSLDNGSKILFERNMEHPIYYGDQLAIKVLSNHPDNILLYDPSTEKIGIDQVIQNLEQNNLAAVIACSQRLKEKLSPIYREDMSVGIYKIFWARKFSSIIKRPDRSEEQTPQTKFLIPLTSIAELQGYNVEYGSFPLAVTTLWMIKNNSDNPLMVQYKLTHIKTGHIIMLHPHNIGNYGNDRIYKKGLPVVDRQSLVLPPKALPGRYTISIKLTPYADNLNLSQDDRTDTCLPLTDVYLITNKRDVLTRLLNGKLEDYELGFKLLTSFF